MWHKYERRKERNEASRAETSTSNKHRTSWCYAHPPPDGHDKATTRKKANNTPEVVAPHSIKFCHFKLRLSSLQRVSASVCIDWKLGSSCLRFSSTHPSTSFSRRTLLLLLFTLSPRFLSLPFFQHSSFFSSFFFFFLFFLPSYSSSSSVATSVHTPWDQRRRAEAGPRAHR